MPPPDPTLERQLTDLLAQALEALETSGEAGLDDFLARHPDAAADLRERLSVLGAHGMLRARPQQEEGVPERLGEFRIKERLGSGGMGVVYLAEQPSLKREVALKLIRPEHLFFPQSRERFRREIEAVAQLQHPGIVRVYSSGEEGGLPFFTMERVEGVSLAQLLLELKKARQAQLGGKELQATLRRLGSRGAEVEGVERSWVELCCSWVRDLALAVEYAHAHGVLHRDIKPANVMITWTGRAMLLDFGLASTSEGARITRTGSRLGSLPYMAPEQVRGEFDRIDARTDVYALGVTLYQALTLANPFADEGSSDEDVRQRVLQATAVPVRQRNTSVAWDAETVCLTAMSAEPERRYRSAAEMALDLQNVLAMRPITARRAGAWVRVRRYLRRHPAQGVALAMGFLLVVVAPTAWAVSEHRLRNQLTEALAKAQEARTKEEEARKKADEALAKAALDWARREETLKFLNDDLLAAVAPGEAGRNASMREVLDRAAERIKKERFKDMPLVEAEIRATLGTTYRKLGMLQEAEEHLLRSVELMRQHSGARSRETMESERKLSQVYNARGKLQECAELERRILKTSREELGPEDPGTLSQGNNFGHLLIILGQYQEAEAILTDVLAIRKRLEREYRDKKDRDQKMADLLYEKALTTMSNLGLAYFQWGRYDEAEPLVRCELELCTELESKDHPDTLISRNNMANLLGNTGRAAEAVVMMQAVIAAQQSVYGESHQEISRSTGSVASLLLQVERYDEAEAMLELSRQRGAALGPDHPMSHHREMVRAELLRRRGKADEALAVLEPVAATPRRGAGDWAVALFICVAKGRTLQDLGRHAEAAALFSEGIAANETLSTGKLAHLRFGLATSLIELGRREEAERQLLSAHAFLAANAGLDPYLTDTMSALVRLYGAWNKPEQAAVWSARLLAHEERRPELERRLLDRAEQMLAELRRSPK